MSDRQQHEWIEQYLLGELSKGEEEQFEQRLETDSGFAREVDRQRRFHQSVTDENALAFRAKLDRIKKEMDDKKSKSRARPFPGKTWLLMAASLAVLAIAAYFLFSEKTTEGPANLFAYAEQESWPVYPNTLFPEVLLRGEERGGGPASQKSDIGVVKSAYLSGDYRQALRALERLPADSIGKDRYFFYRGLLEMRSDQPGAAVASFEQVGAGTYADVAGWNKALSLIAAGRPEEAMTVLETMREKGFKSNEAAQLLDMLQAEEE